MLAASAQAAKPIAPQVLAIAKAKVFLGVGEMTIRHHEQVDKSKVPRCAVKPVPHLPTQRYASPARQ